jgi:hypothetical protein
MTTIAPARSRAAKMGCIRTLEIDRERAADTVV